MKPCFLRPAALLAPFALAACVVGAPPGGTGVTTTPFSAPPSTGMSLPVVSATPAASPTPTLPPGVFFRDEFEGDKLDATRWKAYERGGLVAVKEGWLDMAAAGRAPTFPMVVPLQDTIPKEGPYYVEIAYKFLNAGRPSSFNIDFLPPQSENDLGLTEPLSFWAIYQTQLNVQTRVEGKVKAALAGGGSLQPDTRHRLRYEFDGSNFRIIYDVTELGVFPTQRRPLKFWFGPTPNKPVTKSIDWSRLLVDTVESGVLVSPDPATPRPTASKAGEIPTPTPTATPAPATAAPSASPDATAEPTSQPSASPAA